MTVLNQVIEGVERLFNGRCRIEAVQLVEVDMIQLESAQALFDAADNMVAGATARVDSAGASFAEHLGRHHHVFARDLEVFQRLAGDLFRTPFRVNVGGIDKVDARREGVAHQPLSVVLPQLTNLTPHAAFAAESHGAQAQLGDKETGIAKFLITHRTLLWVSMSVQ